uniref:Ig-like domain-containing protein n=1 Tax=Oryzias latipes TaxID=8090 RepID=A0A3P9LEN9_ORYLA
TYRKKLINKCTYGGKSVKNSVTLTCSSDANPAAKYTWFKDNRTLLSEDKVHFSSIRSEHSGNYSCKSENKHGQSSSTPLLLDVQCKFRLCPGGEGVSLWIFSSCSSTRVQTSTVHLQKQKQQKSSFSSIPNPDRAQRTTLLNNLQEIC